MEWAFSEEKELWLVCKETAIQYHLPPEKLFFRMLNPLRSFEGIEKVVEDLLEEEF